MAYFQDDVQCGKNLVVNGTISPQRPVTELAARALQEFPIDLTLARVWDAMHTVLPATGGTDDLGQSSGTFGTHCPKLFTSDVKNSSTTRYARIAIPVPEEYLTGGAFAIEVTAGMQTTVADTSCVVDVECYLNGENAVVSGSDICATAAQSINSLTLAPKTFTITPTTLTPGALLDVRLTITCVDGQNSNTVIGVIGCIKRICTTQG